MPLVIGSCDDAALWQSRDELRSNALSLGGIGNLDYMILLCSKMEKTFAFYRDVMQFPI